METPQIWWKSAESMKLKLQKLEELIYLLEACDYEVG